MSDINLSDLTERLRNHSLHEHMREAGAVHSFMRSHVFCVWDFQCILKALQQVLTCVSVPWMPTRDRQTRRLINEIVLEEESDEHPDGGYSSHFELYLDAMRACGGDTGPIEALLQNLAQGSNLDDCLNHSYLPAGVPEFLSCTFEVVQSEDLHRLVALFTLTREDLLPDLFRELVNTMTGEHPREWRLFNWYLNRHIELDGERHGPISHALLKRTCGTDRRLWEETEGTARAALKARIDLWDRILEDITRSPGPLGFRENPVPTR